MEDHLNHLETLRNELQEVDIQLLFTLMERFRLSALLGKIKQSHQINPLQETEWARKTSFLSGHLEGQQFSDEILKVFYLIHEQSVEIQEKLARW
jgi:chorismate mutase